MGHLISSTVGPSKLSPSSDARIQLVVQQANRLHWYRRLEDSHEDGTFLRWFNYEPEGRARVQLLERGVCAMTAGRSCWYLTAPDRRFELDLNGLGTDPRR